MNPVSSFEVPADHPSLPGHFPGRPVVPGVVLLDHAVLAIVARHRGRRAAGLPAVKFLRPVLPGQRIEVACGALAEARVAFACTVNGEEVARGTLTLAEEA